MSSESSHFFVAVVAGAGERLEDSVEDGGESVGDDEDDGEESGDAGQQLGLEDGAGGRGGGVGEQQLEQGHGNMRQRLDLFNRGQFRKCRVQ